MPVLELGPTQPESVHVTEHVLEEPIDSVDVLLGRRFRADKRQRRGYRLLGFQRASLLKVERLADQPADHMFGLSPAGLECVYDFGIFR